MSAKNKDKAIEETLLKYISEDIDNSIKELKKSTESFSLAESEQSNWGSLEDLEAKRLYFEIERYRDDTLHRRTLSIWAGTVVSVWLISVILILVGNSYNYKLSDSVLIALLGTTTLNVIALMLVVLNDLFHRGKRK